MISHSSRRKLSSLFFILISSLTGYFQVTCLGVYRLFLLLDQPAVDALHSIFHFIHCIPQLQNFFWLIFMLSLSVKASHFVHLLFSWFCWIVSLFSGGSSRTLKTTIFDLLLGKLQTPFLWALLLENYCVTLLVSCFPWFLLFLEVLCCSLHVWRNSHLLQSLLIGCRRETPFISPAGDSETFWVHLWVLGVHLLHYFFIPSWEAGKS